MTIDSLEKRNKVLGYSMGRFLEEVEQHGMERWEDFKREFRHDMQKLDTALENMGKNYAE